MMLGFKCDVMTVGTPECPNLKRWRLVAPGGMSVRLHHWLRDDPESHTHEHAWGFVTFVLRGGYIDFTPCPACKGTGGHEQVLWHDGADPPSVWLTCSACEGARGARAYMRAGMVRYRGPEHRHAVLDCAGCWSVVFTGPIVRPWRFWINGNPVDAHSWNNRLCD